MDEALRKRAWEIAEEATKVAMQGFQDEIYGRISRRCQEQFPKVPPEVAGEFASTLADEISKAAAETASAAAFVVAFDCLSQSK